MPLLRPLFAAAAAALAMGIAGTAIADGYSSPGEAHSACLAEGANTPAKLRACCDDKILEDPPSKQARLVQECVTHVKQEKSAAEKAADAAEKERRKDEQAARAAQAADPHAKASKSKVGGAAASPAPPDAAASGAAASASQAKGTQDCAAAPTQALLAQLGEVARRFGAAVPATNCPPTRP